MAFETPGPGWCAKNDTGIERLAFAYFASYLARIVFASSQDIAAQQGGIDHFRASVISADLTVAIVASQGIHAAVYLSRNVRSYRSRKNLASLAFAIDHRSRFVSSSNKLSCVPRRPADGPPPVSSMIWFARLKVRIRIGDFGIETNPPRETGLASLQRAIRRFSFFDFAHECLSVKSHGCPRAKRLAAAVIRSRNALASFLAASLV